MRNSILIFTSVVLVACATQDPGVRTIADYRAEAAAVVSTVDAASVMDSVGDDSIVFIDVREADEIESEGKISGAVHVPRGVLEFYIDPASPRHLDVFSSDKTIVFYCATGGRSILATKLAHDMGVSNPVSLDGGFRAWSEAGGAISR